MNKKPEERTYSWIKRECAVASGLYEKVVSELEPGDEDLKDLIPSPIEYVRDSGYYKEWWDDYKESKCEEFRVKHAVTIKELEKTKEENFKKLTMTEDEKLEYFLKKEKEIEEKRSRGEEIYYEPPEEYYVDQKALRGFFNSTLGVYLDLMSKIIELLNTKEFDYISIDHGHRDVSFEERLVNFLEPFENKYDYKQHKESCELGCSKCEEIRQEDMDKHISKCGGCEECATYEKMFQKIGKYKSAITLEK